jgi:hypothetical protein
MKAAWARHEINLALDPHEAKAIWCLSRAGVSDGAPTGLAGEVAQRPVVANLRTVRLRFSQGCLRTSDQGLKLATPRLQLVTLGFSGDSASSIIGRLVSRATLSASSDIGSEL